MKKEKQFVPFKIGLNETGEKIMSAYKEYKELYGKNEVLIAALEVYIDNFKKKDVSEVFRNGSEKDLLTALLGYKVFCVNDEFHCNQAYEFVKEYIADESIKLTTVKSHKPNIITIRKMIGLKATDFCKIFGVTHEEALKYYECGGFAETFVKLVGNKVANEALESMKLPKEIVTVSVSSVYKAENRILYNINVDFNINIYKIDSDLLDKIVKEAEKLREPIDFFM
jgi:hypothetical protein